MTTSSTVRTRHREAMAELERFKDIAEALGVDRDEASRRASQLADERLDLDNAEVFILVLHAMLTTTT